MLSPELINRIIGLVQKTGDKVVLADPVTGKAVVVLDLDAYERLSTGVQDPAHVSIPATTFAPAPAYAQTPHQPVVEAAKTPPPAPPLQPHKTTFTEPIKKPEPSAVSPKRKPIKVGPETMGTTHVMTDLTQEELIDKINRDIGAWKTAQQSRHSDELPAAGIEIPQLATVGMMEEEERFYLEPIE